MAIRRFETSEHTFGRDGVWLKEIAHNQVRISTKVSKIPEFGHACFTPPPPLCRLRGERKQQKKLHEKPYYPRRRSAASLVSWEMSRLIAKQDRCACLLSTPDDSAEPVLRPDQGFGNGLVGCLGLG
jgi:hypothetical protein